MQVLIVLGRRDDYLDRFRHTVDLHQRASAVGEIADDIAHSGLAKNILTSIAGGAAGATAGHFANEILNHTR